MNKWQFMFYWFHLVYLKDYWQDLDGHDLDVDYKDMDEAGLDGWELVQFIPESNTHKQGYLFKRKVGQSPE